MSEWKTESKREATLLGGVVGLGGLAIQTYFPKLSEHVRGGLNHTAHLYKTVGDIPKGPEGMQATKQLRDQTLEFLAHARDNEEASLAIKGALQSRYQFAERLARVYDQNETLSRAIDRAQVQLGGILKNTFEVGNDLKPGFMTKVDDAIIKIFGKNPTEARARSQRIEDFYKAVDQFYTSRNKNEQAVEAFMNHLGETKTLLSMENEQVRQQLENIYPGMFNAVSDTYSVEDVIIDLHERGADVSIDSLIEQHKDQIEELRTEVKQVTPLEDHFPYSDVLSNPFALALGAYLIARGAAKTIIPKFLREGLWNMTWYIPEKSYEKIKSVLSSENKEEVEDDKQEHTD